MSFFPTRVLLATDGSKDAELATTTAVDLANNTNCELHVVFVEQAVYVPGGAGFWSGVPSGYLEQQARKQLDAMVEKVRSAGGEVAEAHLRVGDAAPEIVALAEDIEAGLIVMGSRAQGGIGQALIGGVPAVGADTPTAPCW